MIEVVNQGGAWRWEVAAPHRSLPGEPLVTQYRAHGYATTREQARQDAKEHLRTSGR